MKMKFLDSRKELNVDEEAWKGMKKQLENIREKEFWTFLAEHAARMRVLAMGDVEVTDKGIDLLPPQAKKHLASEATPIPETKQF